MICKTLRNKDKVLEIFLDKDLESPREWDNLGIMMCVHDRYTLGDIEYSNEKFEAIKNDAVSILPVYMFDHSGLTLSTSSDLFSDIDPQKWDWGQVGYIYTTAEKIEEIFGKEMPTKERIEEMLIQEVETYSQYLSGDVYRYTLSKIEKCNPDHEHNEVVDSCGGYYNINDILSDVGAEDWEEQN